MYISLGSPYHSLHAKNGAAGCRFLKTIPNEVPVEEPLIDLGPFEPCGAASLTSLLFGRRYALTLLEKSLQGANLRVALPNLLLLGFESLNFLRYRYTPSFFKRIFFRDSERHDFLLKRILIIFHPIRSVFFRLLIFQGHQLRGLFKFRDLLDALGKLIRRD